MLEKNEKTKLRYFEGRIYNDTDAHFYNWAGLAENQDNAREIMIMNCGMDHKDEGWTPSSDWRIEVRPFLY
jgi:hypothetical protein